MTTTIHRIFSAIVVLGSILLLLQACNKNDYIIGGNKQDVNMYKSLSTYDMLKTNAAFDTLTQVIDAAGIKEKINEAGTTFFAPSDQSIKFYLAQRTLYLQYTVDQYARFGLDSLLYYLANNINGTRDSLSMYIVKQSLTYNTLTDQGALFQTELQGDTVVVSYEETKDENLGYSSSVSNLPRIVYFTQLWYHYDLSEDNPAGNIPKEIGVRTRVSTSGILTQNGVVHVLEPSHSLFFYDTKQ